MSNFVMTGFPSVLVVAARSTLFVGMLIFLFSEKYIATIANTNTAKLINIFLGDDVFMLNILALIHFVVNLE